jgi:Glycosyltransferase family 87
MRRLAPLTTHSAPYAVAAALMLAGWLNLVRGAAHAGVPYRPWAFDQHSYSDVLAMGGDRYFHGGRPTPYVEDRIEYPPLLAAALWLPSFVSRAPWAYFTVSYAALAALALASIGMLGRIPGASRWWLAGSPALAYYTGLNWDHLPIALLLAAVLAESRGRAGSAGAWAGLGVSAKLFPVALLPGALGLFAGRRAWRALATGAAGFALAFAAVNLPVALAAPGAWAHFWRFNAGRGAENSVWELFRHVPALEPLVRDAPFLNRLTFGLLAASAAFAAWGAGRARTGRALRLGAGLVLVTWVATNKVYSPQYALYAVVAGALVSAPAWLGVLVSAIAVVDYHVAFETRASRGLLHYFDAVYSVEEALRTGVFALLAGWLARELWRERRAPAGAADQTGTAGGIAR